MTSKEIAALSGLGQGTREVLLREIAFQLALLNENMATLTIVHATPESWEVRGTKKP